MRGAVLGLHVANDLLRLGRQPLRGIGPEPLDTPVWGLGELQSPDDPAHFRRHEATLAACEGIQGAHSAGFRTSAGSRAHSGIERMSAAMMRSSKSSRW